MSDSSSASSSDAAPASLDELRERLAAGELKLPKRLAQTAAFLVAHPEEVAFGTVASLSSRAGVQPSALIRMAQSVGFSGFSDLQALFRERLREKTMRYDERLTSTRARKGSIPAGLLSDFGQIGIRSIGNLMETLEAAQLEAAVATLAQAETIYLIGQRRSFPVIAYMSYLFSTLGIRNTLLGSPLGTDAEAIALATPRDAALAVTFTPYAPATVAHAHQAAENGCPLVLLTDSPLSPLVPRSRHWLEVMEPNLDGFRTMTATFTLAATLAVAVGGSREKIGT
ncbi:MurR/RpiR family transcriptional regulator [Methylobacterium soli]|uniref:MurR/RpiR family transcriptional regulator n=1 Tax=Methylobacterium soli TaxID=553447 RepID=A0A6L3SZ38_9HYPH|nr:MurR/RpiR family transcriptional regulator [Methylobacterium soli]KAB1077404.1 MurR/RpiR family transcriptional regulator [Methylobacterium soli]GJE44427.1 hypothetical protein AEGHOMDF_3615 [Methylobacterium soli]